jgi:hypothetical protein
MKGRSYISVQLRPFSYTSAHIFPSVGGMVDGGDGGQIYKNIYLIYFLGHVWLCRAAIAYYDVKYTV